MASRSSNPPLLPRAFRAWPLAWPSPSGPLGWQRSPGSTARRRRVPRSSGSPEAEVTRKVRELERRRDSGHVTSAGRALTVAQWMDTWLTTIAPRRVRRSPLDGTYVPKVYNRIIPGPRQTPP